MASSKNRDSQFDFLYILQHFYEDEGGEHIKTIGLFTTREKAEETRSLLADKPGFKDHPDGFSLEKIYLDHPEWLEGFGV